MSTVGGGVHGVALDGGVVDIHGVIRRWRRGVVASWVVGGGGGGGGGGGARRRRVVG